MGSANSVQAYWRLPIITMPTKADHNRNHRFIVRSSGLVARLCTGSHKEDHTASPKRSDLETVIRWISSLCGCVHGAVHVFVRQTARVSVAITVMTSGSMLRRCWPYSSVSLNLYDLDSRFRAAWYTVYWNRRFRPHRRKFLNAANRFNQKTRTCTTGERAELYGESLFGIEGRHHADGPVWNAGGYPAGRAPARRRSRRQPHARA